MSSERNDTYDLHNEMDTVTTVLTQGTWKNTDMSTSKEYIQKGPGRKELKHAIEQVLAEKGKNTLMTKKMRTTLQEAYILFGGENTEALLAQRNSLLTPYLEMDPESNDFFPLYLNNFLKGIYACKQVFPEIGLAEVKLYNARYTDSIQKGDSDGFNFEDLAICKQRLADKLSWQHVGQLTNNGQYNFDFRAYEEMCTAWGPTCTTELFLSLKEQDPESRKYVKELWGDKITPEHRKKYPQLDPRKLISLQHAVTESGQETVPLSDDLREKIGDDRYSQKELEDILVPYDADGLPKKLEWDKGYLLACANPNASLFLRDRYNEQDIQRIFAYLERKGWLSNITLLRLDGNGLTVLPEQIKQCTNLKKLDVRDNKLSTFPDWLSSLTQLKTIDFTNNDFSVFPEVITGLSTLETLYCSGNKLTTLSNQLGLLTHLKYLSIGNNKLTTLPESIGQLENLYEFSANNNQLTDLPHLLGCKSLENVRLENNEFTNFPQTLLELKNMHALILKDNKIDQLPTNIHQLENLEYLNVENNNLTELPNQLIQLPLTDLNISGNNITDVSILKNMYSLDSLEMRNNTAIDTLPELPPSISEIIIDKTLTIPEDMNYHLEEKWKTDDSIRTLNKLSTLSDLSDHLEQKTLTPNQYRGIAKHNPLLFIQILEESRRYNAADAQTREEEYFYFSAGGLPKREEILAKLDASTLVALISRGSQELLRSYESTFFHIFHTWLKKDVAMQHIGSLRGPDQWKLVSTIVQLSPRYLHLSGSNVANIQKLLQKTMTTYQKELLNNYNEITAMQSILPIVILARSGDKTIQGVLLPFLKQLTVSLQQFRKDPKNEKFHLTGLLFAQIEECGIPAGLTPDEKKTYALPDLKHMQSLDVQQRNEQNPCVTRLFFDNDSDGKESFGHRLWTIGLVEGKSKVTKGAVTYTLEKQDGFVYIEVATPKGVVAHIVANHPEAADSNGSEIESFLGKKIGIDSQEQKITYDFVVDRGHAGNEQAGLAAISKDTEIALIGSCGGFTHMAKALQKNAGLQYIGTTGTGVMSVNDAYFRSITESIATQQGPHRPTWSPKSEYIKEYTPGQYAQHVASYQLPDSNILIPFKNALDKLEREDKE